MGDNKASSNQPLRIKTLASLFLKWILFLSIFLIGVPLPLQAKSHDRPAPVGVQTLVLHDGARNRDVPIKVYYPRGQSPALRFPVILFSPEAGSSKDAYGYLGNYWAQHGYVCVSLTHKGSDAFLLKRGRPLASLRAIIESTQKDENLINRPLDISFVIDSLPTIEDQVSNIKDRIDPTRLGVAGHSFGAYTALATAGAVVHLSDGTPRSFQDNRIVCFIALSSPGLSTLGFDAESFRPILRPVLTMSGSQDRGLNGEPADWRLETYKHLPLHHKFQIVIQGAAHMDFNDRQFDGSRGNTRYHSYIEKATLAFWDAYLKDNQTIQQQLSTGNFPPSKGVKAAVQFK
jgi:predicted dienelactone hydrolase